MNKGKIRIKEIVDLTLEIICLLTGEVRRILGGHMTSLLSLLVKHRPDRRELSVVKSGRQVSITLPPSQSIPAGRVDVQKILELANKITELLTGEIGSEEKMELMEDWPRKDKVITTERCPNLPYSRDPTQEHHYIPHHDQREDLRDAKTAVKKEEEMYVRAAQQSTEVVKMMVRIKEEESSAQIGTRELYMSNILEGQLDITQDAPGVSPGTPDINLEGPSLCKPKPCPEKSEYSTWESGFVEDQKMDTDLGTFRCSECAKGFAHAEDRNKHQTTHAKRKPFSCSDCEKRFLVKSKLIRHVRVHTGEKPYSCAACGRCFSNKKNLAVHVHRLHPDDKLFSCSDCAMCFQEKGRLVMHRRIHASERERPRPYACPECRKGFAKNSDLVRHRRTHTGEKPFSCSECGKCFAQKAQLITHLRVHKVEKPASSSEFEGCPFPKSQGALT